MHRIPEGEPCFPQAPQRGVVVLGARGTRTHPRLHEADRPRMAPQSLPNREAARAQLRLPCTTHERGVDLAEDDVDHAVEEILLVREVPVEGHRRSVKVLSEVAHAARLEATRVRESDGGLDD